jgi:hypothetical protein
MNGQSRRLHNVGIFANSQALNRDTLDLAALMYLICEKASGLSSQSTFSERQLQKFLRTTEPELVRMLLAQLRRREASDASFARELDRARQEVQELEARLVPIQTQVASTISSEAGSDGQVPEFLQRSGVSRLSGHLIVTVVLIAAVVFELASDKPALTMTTMKKRRSNVCGLDQLGLAARRSKNSHH